jgi:hypothetical protein
VRNDIVQALAIQASAQKADEYTQTLWREELTKDAPRVLDLARSLGAVVNKLEPFARGNAPTGLDLDQSQLDAQWSLVDSERFFSDVLQGNMGSSVVIFNNTIAARQRSLTEARDDVLKAYTADRRSSLFADAGKAAQKQLADAVKAGKNFKAHAESLGMKVDTYSAIKVNEAPASIQGEGRPIAQLVRMMPATVSQFQITDEGGYVIYLAVKDAPAFDTVRPSKEEVDQLRKTFAAMDSWEMLSSLVNKREAELDAADKAMDK